MIELQIHKSAVIKIFAALI